MNRLQQGFTLIELMIVVAIIGILAAVAIPSYQDYTARAQVSEGMSLTSALKTPLAEWYADNGSFPTGPAQISETLSGKYVSNIDFNGYATTDGGTIDVRAQFKGAGKVNAKIQSEYFALRTEDGARTWVCGTLAPETTVDSKYVPGACK